jgi:hypothetical protein
MTIKSNCHKKEFANNRLLKLNLEQTKVMKNCLPLAVNSRII